MRERSEVKGRVEERKCSFSRKSISGMLLCATESHEFGLECSITIGDKNSDM